MNGMGNYLEGFFLMCIIIYGDYIHLLVHNQFLAYNPINSIILHYVNTFFPFVNINNDSSIKVSNIVNQELRHKIITASVLIHW